MAESVKNVRRWAHVLTREPTPLSAFRALDVPVLYMTGQQSTPSAHGVARLLTAALPQVEVVAFEHLGHMGPITHPEVVNPVIEQFLQKYAVA
jgi:pimeloyl-ACP methyl ester carboxylesterase